MSLTPEKVKEIQATEEPKAAAAPKVETRDQVLTRAKIKLNTILDNLKEFEGKRDHNPFAFIALNKLATIKHRLEKAPNEVTPEMLTSLFSLPDKPDCKVDCGYPEGHKEKRVS